MCDIHEYEVLINNKFNNTKIDLPEYPDLNITYINSENNLCASNYFPLIVCIWEGDISLTLDINNKRITLNDHDKRNNKSHQMDDYEFQGIEPIVENQSKDQTYIRFSIKKCSNDIKNYNLGHYRF